MNLFQMSKLAGRLQHMKLLKGDSVHEQRGGMVRIKNGHGFVTLVRVRTHGGVPEYGQAGARDCYLGEDEHNRRVDYYLKKLGYKTRCRIVQGEFGMLRAVKL